MSNFASAPKFNPDAPYEEDTGSSMIGPNGIPRINIGGRQEAPKFDPNQPFEEDRRGLGAEAVRQVGLTARYGIEGGMMPVTMLGDAVNAAVNLGIRGANRVTGANIPQFGTTTEALKNTLSALPGPETPTERVVGEASRTVASVPAFAGAAAASGVRALRPLIEKIGTQMTSAAGAGTGFGVAKEKFPDNPVAQGVAGLAGGMAGGLRAAEPTAQVAQRLSDFAESGIRPAIQDVTQSSTWQRIAKMLEAIPFTSDTVRAREISRLREAETAAGRVSGGYGEASSPTAMGERVQQGVDQYRFGARPQGMSDRDVIRSPTRASSISAKADALYNRVPIEQTAVLDVPETVAALRGASQKYNNPGLSEVFSTPLARRVLAAVEGGDNRMMWRDLRQLRTDLRYQRARAQIDPSIDDRILGLVDDAITRDLTTGATTVGGPRAAQEIARADRYYALSMQDATNRLKSVFNANRPEQVWGQIENAISARANKGDIGKLMSLRRALPREAWDDIAATIVDGLGRPTSGRALPAEMPQFSAAEFVTKFGNMSEQAKSLLFDGAGRGDLRSALEALNRSLQTMKNTDRMANVSQSGNAVIGAGTGVALLTNPVKTAAILGGTNLTARAMYNPTFVRLMTRTLRANNPASVQSTALQLTNFAQKNPAFADDVASLMQGLVPARAEQKQETSIPRR